MLAGPQDALQATEHAQPAIVFHSLALLRHLQARNLLPAAVAGHSLGEFVGLVAAGGLDPLDALEAVRARGTAMAAAVPSCTGMAAVIGLSDEALERVIQNAAGVVPANYNAPGQVVISGTDEALEAITPALQKAGAKRVLRLPVSGAFHSPLMVEAARSFRTAWEHVPLERLARPQVFNADAQVHHDAQEIRELMVRQLTGPVRWSDSVRRLAGLGIETFVEIGPGRTLTGLVKKILPEAQVHNIEDLARLGAFLEVAHAG